MTAAQWFEKITITLVCVLVATLIWDTGIAPTFGFPVILGGQMFVIVGFFAAVRLAIVYDPRTRGKM